jgi:two-component system chemotaxis response regulator CheY
MTQPHRTPGSDPKTLALPAVLDAESAAALIQQMNALSRSSEIRLDAAAVTAISPGYLQILVSAFKTFPQLSVSDVSAVFAETFADCGIDYPQAVPAAETDTVGRSDADEGNDASPTAEAAPEMAAELTAGAKPDTESAPVAEPTVRTVLTIDDSRTMRDMLNMALSGAGFAVVQAVDGEDGLVRLAQQPVDVIITDINMPKLDGYGVIRAVRSDPAYDNTPILVLSTEGEQESKDIAKDAGATGWIVKPFDPAGLVNIVNSVCG